MDTLASAILIATTIVTGLGFLGALATVFGADSRPSIGDDHAR